MAAEKMPSTDDDTPISRRCILAKLGSRERMKALAETGTVYMQKLSVYVKLENPAVGDPNEGLLARYTPENPTLRIVARVGDQELPLPGASLKINSTALDHGVYCMSAIETTSGDLRGSLLAFLADRRLRDFGDTLVLFKDTPEFIRRLEAAAAAVGHELDHQAVTYVASTHCGDMGPFRKLDSYSHQQEWRFVTSKAIDDTLVLQLGSLLDIAAWVDLDGVPTG